MAHRRVDVHQHAVPSAYAEWLRAKGIQDAGGWELPAWSAEDALRLMDEHDIAAAILSVSAPGVHLDPSRHRDPEARAMARRVNEHLARVTQDHPARLGFFATLTLPDVDGALEEAAYAFDSLGAAGVILLANSHGRYLGAPEDAPLLAELDRRRAVVFVHPTALPGAPAEGIPPFAADFLLDTTRAAYRLVQSGAMGRYPNLRIILSHAGGFVPYASTASPGPSASPRGGRPSRYWTTSTVSTSTPRCRALPPRCRACWRSPRPGTCSSAATGPSPPPWRSATSPASSTPTARWTRTVTTRSTGGTRRRCSRASAPARDRSKRWRR